MKIRVADLREMVRKAKVLRRPDKALSSRERDKEQQEVLGLLDRLVKKLLVLGDLEAHYAAGQLLDSLEKQYLLREKP